MKSDIQIGYGSIFIRMSSYILMFVFGALIAGGLDLFFRNQVEVCEEEVYELRVSKAILEQKIIFADRRFMLINEYMKDHQEIDSGRKQVILDLYASFFSFSNNKDYEEEYQ